MRVRGHLLRDAAKGLQCMGAAVTASVHYLQEASGNFALLVRGSTMEIQLAFGNVFHILFCAGTFAGPPTALRPSSADTRPPLLLEC